MVDVLKDSVGSGERFRLARSMANMGQSGLREVLMEGVAAWLAARE